MKLEGRLLKPQDLSDVIKFFSSKGKPILITLRFPHSGKEFKFFVVNGKLCLENTTALDLRKTLTLFFEEWSLSKEHPHFEVSKSSTRENLDNCLSLEEFFSLLSNIKVEDLKRIPSCFIVKKAFEGEVPKFLRVASLLKKPLTFRELHEKGIPLGEVITLARQGKVVIEPYKSNYRFKVAVKVLFYLLFFLSLFLLLFPGRFTKLLVSLNRLEIINQVEAGRILGKVPSEVSCEGKKFKVIISEEKIFVLTKFGKYEVGRLPKKGFIPFFEVPVK